MSRLLQFEKNIFINKIFMTALILSLMSIIFIYSAEYSQNHRHLLYLKQFLSLIIGIILYFIMSRLDYHLYTGMSIIIYLGGIVLLLFVLIFGVRINGAKSWINLGFFNGQLSEFAKIAYIIAFANFITRYQDQVDSNRFFILSFIFLSPFLILLMIEPDFGTGIIFFCIFLVMFFAGGGNTSILVFLFPIFVLSILIPFSGFLIKTFYSKNIFWNYFNFSISQILFIALILMMITLTIFIVYYVLNRSTLLVLGMIFLIFSSGFFGASMFKSFLKDYHYQRMLVTIRPDLDPERQGYNLNQSLISIGGGRITGYGLTKGPQNRGNFLPANHTDFILSVIAEEWGFLGVLLVLLLNVFLIFNLLKSASETRDFLGVLIIVGIAGLFISHFLINVLSVSGILPIIGNPLPLLSYGGSSMVSCFIGLGIVNNINSTRYRFKAI